jgi:hypothetical protein
MPPRRRRRGTGGGNGGDACAEVIRLMAELAGVCHPRLLPVQNGESFRFGVRTASLTKRFKLHPEDYNLQPRAIQYFKAMVQ